MPRASSLAAEIETEFGATPELVGGGNGVYDVVVDGARIFSKDASGRFPEPGEIARAIRAAGDRG